MDKKSNKIIVIAGPTASGKTAMGVELAKKINGEIINADSRTIYKEMNVGTGKPAKEEMQTVPHHLFDIINPDEEFSVADFKKLAKEKINEIQKRGKTPILVGGTGFYIDAVIYNFDFPKTEPDEAFRKELEKKNIEELVQQLESLDKKAYEKIDLKNKRKVIRALEYLNQTESSITEQKRSVLPKNVYYFAIDLPRIELYTKINERVRKMFKEESLLDEIKGLLKKYPKDLPMLQTMGYREGIQYFNGELSLTEAINKTQQAHRNLAKKQMTWFRRNKDIVWIKNLDELEKFL